jgi:hypothetical protein
VIGISSALNRKDKLYVAQDMPRYTKTGTKSIVAKIMRLSLEPSVYAIVTEISKLKSMQVAVNGSTYHKIFLSGVVLDSLRVK